MAARGLSHLAVAKGQEAQALNREVIPYVRDLQSQIGLLSEQVTALTVRMALAEATLDVHDFRLNVLEDRVGIATDNALRISLGPALLHWWEPRLELVTLSGSDVNTIAPLAGDAALSARVGSVPLVTSGGPADRPYVALPLAGSNRLSGALNISGSNRVGLYTVVRFNGTFAGSAYVAFATRTGGGNTCLGHQTDTASNAFSASMRFTSGGQTGTSPFIAGFHLLSSLPLGTGASLRVDNVPFTTNVTGNNPIQDQMSVELGHAGLSGGDWAGSLLVDLSNDEAARDLAVRNYVGHRFLIAT